jgi:LacI family transcriptional regulator/LacI family repressor for deo operon, udp, cdd, tsx, nupC, and nupG
VSDAQPPAQRPTISDVARAAAVSKATVSAVLNDAPGVRESTRERVREAMERLNYRPARAVPGRSGPRHQPAVGAMIALIIKEHDNPYYAAIVDGVRSVLEAGGHSLLIVSTGGDSAAERRAVTRLHAAGVDGFIVTPVLGQDGDLSHFFELRRRNVPLVLLERVRGLPASLVDVDNVDVSRAPPWSTSSASATRASRTSSAPATRCTRTSASTACDAPSAPRGLMLRDEDLCPPARTSRTGYRAGLARFGGRSGRGAAHRRHLLQRPGGDRLCRALAELGLRVPEDVSVVGYDDIPLCTYVPGAAHHRARADAGDGCASRRGCCCNPHGARRGARRSASRSRRRSWCARRPRRRAAAPRVVRRCRRAPPRRPAPFCSRRRRRPRPRRAPGAPPRPGADARPRRAGPWRGPPHLHPPGRRRTRATAAPRGAALCRPPRGAAPTFAGAPTPAPPSYPAEATAPHAHPPQAAAGAAIRGPTRRAVALALTPGALLPVITNPLGAQQPAATGG